MRSEWCARPAGRYRGLIAIGVQFAVQLIKMVFAVHGRSLLNETKRHVPCRSCRAFDNVAVPLGYEVR
jgi:hypothetical protein